MCFKPAKAPEPDPVPKKETRGDAALKASNEARLNSNNDFYGNIFTTALGDSGYGENAKKIAKLGGATA